MQNKCLTNSVVYQAAVTTNIMAVSQSKCTLVLPKPYSKQDTITIKLPLVYQPNPAKRKATELSEQIWDLKNKNINMCLLSSVAFRLVGLGLDTQPAKSYNSASNRCKLCLWEKYFIMCEPKISTLNKRNELVLCRHAKKFL